MVFYSTTICLVTWASLRSLNIHVKPLYLRTTHLRATILCWLLSISSLSFYQSLSEVTLISLHLQFMSPVPSWQPLWENSLHEFCQLGLSTEVIVTSAMKGLMWADTTLGNDLGCIWSSCHKDVGLSKKTSLIEVVRCRAASNSEQNFSR